MSEQTERAEADETLGQGPVDDAGPRPVGDDPVDEVIVDATVVEEQDEDGVEPEGEATGASEAGDETSAEAEAPTEDDGPAPEPEETPLQLAERERGEYLELAQRSRAEFENFRKRAAAQAAAAEIRGKAELARRLVPALDNLERALLAAGIDPDSGPTDGGTDALAGGVALVLGEFREGLRAAGVESFNPAGERFDPNLHEAIATGAAEGAESGTVIETTEKGYRIGEQILRPARVVVAG